MNVYQLEDKATDLDFLAGKGVVCRAAIDARAKDANITAGEVILVLLSNGKKYKGQIREVSFITLNNFSFGELTITKTAL